VEVERKKCRGRVTKVKERGRSRRWRLRGRRKITGA